MLTATQTRKLAALRYYRSGYELVASRGDTRILVGYTAGKGRRDILKMLQRNGEKWLEYTGASEFTFGTRAADGATLGEWTIRYSGRTEREAIIEGELPFIGEVTK